MTETNNPEADLSADLRTFFTPQTEKADEPPAEEDVADDAEQDGADGESAADSGDATDTVSENDGEQPEKSKRSTAARINKLTADKRHFERIALAQQERLNQLEEKLKALTEKSDPLTGQKPDDNNEGVKAPDPEKYRYGELDPQYIADLADYRAELKLQAFQRTLEETQQRSAAEREAEAKAAQLRQKATEVEALGASQFEDFAEVVVRGAEVGAYPLTQEMFELAVETEAAPAILYYLAQNPAEADAVSRMDARRQALWFGRMEAKLVAPKPPAAKRTTQAPAPITPARGGGGKFSVAPDTDDLEAFAREFFRG